MVDERLRQAANRLVTAEEIRDALTQPIDDEERAQVTGLIRWFTRRYSTPEARLAYVREAYARWRRAGSA